MKPMSAFMATSKQNLGLREYNIYCWKAVYGPAESLDLTFSKKNVLHYSRWLLIFYGRNLEVLI